jgi:hypothetical protein
MFSLVLASTLMLGSLPTQQPTVSPMDADIGGQTVRVWGWRDAAGNVRFHPSQNPHVTGEMIAKLHRAKPTAMPGVTLTGGTLDAGVNLQGESKVGHVITNDPDLKPLATGDEGEDCPDGRCPNQPLPPFIERRIEDHVRPYLLPAALIVAALVIALSVRRKD